MREILFRGQTRRKGERIINVRGDKCDSNWVYGGIFPQNNGGDFAIIYQQTPEIKKYTVYADTVGQYTGLTDKNGTKIFEGDIIEINHPYAGKFVSEVIWDIDCWSLKDFYFTCFDYPNMAFSEGTEYMKVIGNIYDNPELLKKE